MSFAIMKRYSQDILRFGEAERRMQFTIHNYSQAHQLVIIHNLLRGDSCLFTFISSLLSFHFYLFTLHSSLLSLHSSLLSLHSSLLSLHSYLFNELFYIAAFPVLQVIRGVVIFQDVDIDLHQMLGLIFRVAPHFLFNAFEHAVQV